MKVFSAQPDKQSGVAILLAMSVVAFAALAAMAMVVVQSTGARRLELRHDHAQALLMTRAGMDWARAVLGDDSRASPVDHLGEPWAIQLPPVPVENGSLSGHIEDQQGKYNLNNIVRNGEVNPLQLASFQRLLDILALPETLADTLASYGLLGDVAELAQVDGYNNTVRARLRPYVTALPQFTAVNVNTASPEVLAALINGLALDDARTLTAQRERGFYGTPADFFNLLPANLVVANENIAVNSRYFMVAMKATIREAEAKGSALLFREQPAVSLSNHWPTVIWSRFQ